METSLANIITSLESENLKVNMFNILSYIKKHISLEKIGYEVFLDKISIYKDFDDYNKVKMLAGSNIKKPIKFFLDTLLKSDTDYKIAIKKRLFNKYQIAVFY